MTVSARARWIAVIAGLATAAGLLNSSMMLVQISVMTLCWLAWQWFSFRHQLARWWPQVTLNYTLSADGMPVDVLWSQRPVDVHAALQWPSLQWSSLQWPNLQWSSLGQGLYAEFEEQPPLGMETLGELQQRRWLSRAEVTEIRYRIVAKQPGLATWTGLRVRLFDLHGLFRADRFLPHYYEVLVLPPLLALRNADRLHKRQNQLPPPGHHRHVRPGMGSELLEIREYVPGDSPRAIAWKLSARRDVLMTKQYESEVPVRVRLVVDASPSLRWRHPLNSEYARLVELAGLIAETMIANRDAVGLSLLNGDQLTIIPPSARRQTTLQIVKTMLTALRSSWAAPRVPLDELIPAAMLEIQRSFPECLHGPLLNIPIGFFPWGIRRRAEIRVRLALAMFLAGYFELPPSDFHRMTHSDEALSVHLQHFLFARRVPFPASLINSDGQSHLLDASKPQRLGKLLMQAVASAHDNELFVLMVDMNDLEDLVPELEKGIKIAIAKHHRVIVLCAWPPGLPHTSTAATTRSGATTQSTANTRSSPSAAGAAKTRSGPTTPSAATPSRSADGSSLVDSSRWLASEKKLAEFAWRTEAARRLAQQDQLQRRFSRLRVPVLAASSQRAPQSILEQVELLKSGRKVR